MVGGNTHDAYHNNAYGLIEYICNSDSFMVDYKNRQGERRRVSVTYEQIYSVMEYLIQGRNVYGQCPYGKVYEGFCREAL